MSAGDKLHALLRTCEADEQNAAREFSMLQGVLEERQAKLQALNRQRGELLEKLAGLDLERKSGGPNSSSGKAVSSITSYTKRLTVQIEKLEDTIQESAVDVARAEQRCGIAEEELIEARIEKKKIEKLISGREQVERNTQQAREEVSNDELSSGKHRK
ncbi:MAG: flagellar FliJ family protein [Bdellovibrionales bacterium]|nr:flagellar FliJ family protein [Bdellovibrionales bacterium]